MSRGVEPHTPRRWALQRWALRAVVLLLVAAMLVTLGTALRVWQVAREDDRSPADAIVVLGAAQYNGVPSAVFRARLNHAAELYHQDVAPVVLTSGGAGRDDVFTEAEAGARWLVDQGVPEDDAVPIGAGVNTFTSLEAVSEELTERGLESVVVVSDPWHSLRSRTIARDLGMAAWTSPTRSGPMVQSRATQARYIVRETGAMLYYWVTDEPAEDIAGVGLG